MIKNQLTHCNICIILVFLIKQLKILQLLYGFFKLNQKLGCFFD